MKQTEYLNFDLMIERKEDGYQARVLASPAGEAVEDFAMPFSSEELVPFLTELGQPGQGVETFEDQVKVFGSRLFGAAFKGEIYACLRVSLQEAKNMEKGLRLRLHLTDVPDLAVLPWEYLYHPNFGFFSCSSQTPVVRYMHMAQGISPLKIKLPLRVLVMISHPGDYPPLDADKELANLNESFDELRRQGLVEIDLLEEATESALRQRLRRKGYHVFHFIGHGGYDEGKRDGFLVIKNDANYDYRLYGKGLADCLRSRASLRLVVLNSCDGAHASLTDPFGGTAQSLMQAGIPAVIAMQFPIIDQTAVAFAKEFYRAMADYYPVDAALAEARLAMNEWERGTPALYMRSPDGCVFTNETPVVPEPIPAPASNPDEVYYRGMKKAIEEGKLVCFLGAGANLCGRTNGEWQKGPYAPSDGELATHLSSIRPLPDNTNDLACVSQYIALEDSDVLGSALRSVFTLRFRATPLHEFLARLPRLLKEKGCAQRHQLIVTTNYDDVLEDAFKQAREPYDLVCYITAGEHSGKFYHRPYRGKTKIILQGNDYDEVSLDHHTVILKLHGAVDRADPSQDSYIITEDNYIDHLTRMDFYNRLPINIVNKLDDEYSRFLFLGYRLRDWNLRIIFRRIWGEKGPESKSWALGLDTDPVDPVDIEFWKKRNVGILHNMDLKCYVEEMERRLKE